LPKPGLSNFTKIPIWILSTDVPVLDRDYLTVPADQIKEALHKKYIVGAHRARCRGGL